MSPTIQERFFDWRRAFDHHVTMGLTVGLIVLLIVAPVMIYLLTRRKDFDAKLARELWQRYLTWLILVPLMVLPILAGQFWTTIAVCILSIGCYLELLRNTSLKGEWSLHGIAILGTIVLSFGALDHWWELFTASVPVTIVVIAIVAILPDQPHGYLQRLAVPSTAFVLFGAGLGHLSYMSNDSAIRPMLILVLLCVEINDILAFVCGKMFGQRKMAPNTSPGKTWGGGLGAIVLTTALFASIGRFVFTEPLRQPGHLMILGASISLLGQMGDLMLSSIKRDLGIKDLGSLLPGHGGLLDRFDSLILVSPAIFYYIGYFQGLALDEPIRILTSPS